MPSRHFFVYRVHRDDGVCELTNYIMQKGITIRELTKTSHTESKFNSFKLIVSKDDADKVNDSQFWPQGIYIRRWHEEKQNSMPEGKRILSGVEEKTDSL